MKFKTKESRRNVISSLHQVNKKNRRVNKVIMGELIDSNKFFVKYMSCVKLLLKPRNRRIIDVFLNSDQKTGKECKKTCRSRNLQKLTPKDFWNSDLDDFLIEWNVCANVE